MAFVSDESRYRIRGEAQPFWRADGTSKGDWDVGITIDILDRAEHCDVVVLASGDGDFDLLVQHVRHRFSIDVEVYRVPQLTAGTLMEAATRFVPIDSALLLQTK